MRKNTVLYEAPAPITVEVNYTPLIIQPATVEDLVNLKIENNNNGSTYYTDNNGNVNINANLGTSLTYKQRVCMLKYKLTIMFQSSHKH